jgi:hypothetical protein
MSKHTATTFPLLLLHPHLNPKHNPYFLIKELVLHNSNHALLDSGPEFSSLSLPNPPPNRSAATIRRLVHSALDAQPRKRIQHMHPTCGVAANVPEKIDRAWIIGKVDSTVGQPYRGRTSCAIMNFAERVKGMIRASVIRPEEYMHFPDFLSGFARIEAWNLFLWAVVCVNGGVQTGLLVHFSPD